MQARDGACTQRRLPHALSLSCSALRQLPHRTLLSSGKRRLMGAKRSSNRLKPLTASQNPSNSLSKSLLPTGIAYKGDIFGVDEAEATLETNVFGTARVCRAAAPLLVPGRSRIVNISSMAGVLRIVPSDALRARCVTDYFLAAATTRTRSARRPRRRAALSRPSGRCLTWAPFFQEHPPGLRTPGARPR
jgi:hypothetical protein